MIFARSAISRDLRRRSAPSTRHARGQRRLRDPDTDLERRPRTRPCISSGSQPEPTRPDVNCIAKQDACAAASSSSGLVCAWSSSTRAMPGDLELGQRAGGRRDDLPLAVDEAADPLDLGSAYGRHLGHHLHSSVGRRRAGPRGPAPRAAPGSRPRAGRGSARASSAAAARGPARAASSARGSRRACRRSGSARRRCRRSPAAARSG